VKIMRIAHQLERLANVAILVTAVVAICTWMWLYLQGRPATGLDSGALYATGETLPEIQLLPAAGHAHTLILFVHSQCKYCTEAMPFYRQILQLRDHSRQSVAVVALSREPTRSLETYLKVQNLPVDGASSVPTEFRLRLTPTILYVDSTRTINRVWTGRLTTAEEGEILHLLGQ
jgi:peroxiredoxin